MKKLILSASVVAFSFLLTNCTQTSESKVENEQEKLEQDIQSEKKEIAKDLQNVRDDINNKLDKISKKMDEEKSYANADLVTLKETLIIERNKVQSALADLDNAAETNWGKIQLAAKNTAADAKIECAKLGDRLDAAMKVDNK